VFGRDRDLDWVKWQLGGCRDGGEGNPSGGRDPLGTNERKRASGEYRKGYSKGGGDFVTRNPEGDGPVRGLVGVFCMDGV